MHLVVNSVASALLADKRRDFTNNFEMRFIIWERSVQKKTDFWIVLCCILKEPKINMLEFSCWCKKNSQSIHEELHSIPLIFLNKKSEIWNDFTIFEKWKVKNFLPSLFSRSESENQMTQNRDREVKVKIKWLKIEIEKWIFKKILENRDSRWSLNQINELQITFWLNHQMEPLLFLFLWLFQILVRVESYQMLDLWH